jgi:hypothetical protein
MGVVSQVTTSVWGSDAVIVTVCDAIMIARPWRGFLDA